MWWLYVWLIPCAVAYIFLSWVRRWIRIDNIVSRYILVTGCDSGFGNLLTQRLDMLGCHVFATCLTESAKNRLQQVTSSRLKAFTMDVTNSEQVRQAVDYVSSNIPETEGLWGLVNNAGILGSKLGPVEWHSLEDFKDVFDVNTMGVVRVTLAFLPLLKKAKGRVVNMSGVHGRVAWPPALPYSMSKAAVESFTDGIRSHLAQYDVTVHLIEPGAFQTNILDKQRIRKAVQLAWKAVPWHVKEEFGDEYCAAYTSMMTSSTVDNASPKVNKVTKAYMHALTARCPRMRYTVGFEARFLWIPLSYLPSVIIDYVLIRQMKPLVPAILKKNGEKQATATVVATVTAETVSTPE